MQQDVISEGTTPLSQDRELKRKKFQVEFMSYSLDACFKRQKIIDCGKYGGGKEVLVS